MHTKLRPRRPAQIRQPYLSAWIPELPQFRTLSIRLFASGATEPEAETNGHDVCIELVSSICGNLRDANDHLGCRDVTVVAEHACVNEIETPLSMAEPSNNEMSGWLASAPRSTLLSSLLPKTT